MLEYWLWLAGRRGIGARGLCALLAQFGTPEAVFCAQQTQYPAQLRENGDYQHPCRMASGLDAVLVAGEPAVIRDTYTGVRAGTVIRRDTL